MEPLTVDYRSAGTAAGLTQYRWVICALLFLATTINYVDRQILSLLKPMLDGQLHWTNTQFGWINSAFQASYGVSLFAFGYIVDRFGTRRGYALSIFGWSLAAMGHALVSSIGGFFVARVALGLSEGGNFPAAIKAAAQWFPRRERAFATSLFNSGANIGAVVAPALVPPIAAHFGWHAAFLLAGAAGMLWLVAWFPLFDDPQRSRRVSAAELAHIESDADAADPTAGGGDARVTVASVFRFPQAWSFVVAKFLTDPVWWFFLIWLPDYFKAARHLDIKGSWPLLVSIYSIVTVLSIVGGWDERGPDRPRVVGHGRPQGRHAHLRPVRRPDRVRHARRQLGRRRPDRPGRGRPPGVVGHAVHDHVRPVPQAGRGHPGRYRQHGRVARRDDLPGRDRHGPGPLRRARLRGRVRLLRGAYLVAFAVSHVLAPSFAPVPFTTAEPAGFDALTDR